MISASEVTACLVTRGDVDMTEIIDSLPFERVSVYDNQPDLGVYGRYAAVARVDTPYAFTQDDDALLAPEAFETLLAACKPGHVVCNMPERFREHYPDSALVGFGAIFGRDLPLIAFGKFTIGLGQDKVLEAMAHQPEFFRRECDTVFTGLTPRILVDVPYTDMPWASDPSRLWKQPEHYGERQKMLQLVRQVRDALP